ncbi:MAG: hypothetical protein K2P92_04415 [Bdellovibrionaceae bacterium]|nr:hypothetical protein [Pseudobdellovibrionaceae bacterium]
MITGLLSLDLEKSKKGFFKSQQIFIVPGILILLAIAVELMGVTVPSYNEAFATYVVDFLFINNSHAVFSLAAIFFIPEAATVVANKKRHFYFVTAILLFILLLLTVAYKLDVKSKFFVEIILSYFGLWHAIKQTYGLVRAYSVKYLNEVKSRKEVFFEKFLIYILLFSSVSFNPRTLLRYQNFFGLQFNTETVHQFGLLFMAITLFVLCFINLKKVHSISAGLLKLLYLLPYAVFPYSGLTVLGFVTLKAVHGIQAYYLYRNIYQESRASSEQKNYFLAVSCLLMTFQAFAYIFSLSESRHWLNILVSYLTISVSYIHYYHERFLFKLKNQPELT